MGVVQIIVNGPVSKGSAELNNHLRDEQKEIRGGVTGEGQGLSEEDESRINEDVEDVNDGGLETVEVQIHAKAVLQRPQQQPQGPLVCWKRFLPLRSLKVLLVESDDATRRVICALLQSCGYEVIAVENGLQAWKILEDQTNQIDLVLTEAIMPCLSGIGLLHKIMSHKTCKNIPMIMMSSHDSMSIVCKCLSKGAVYFLVKPVRKNELQNLWQHVWRKCHTSSGSGSDNESGIMTQKSTKLKNAEELDNNSGSNDEDDIGSFGLNRDGSDHGSGTQSSWTMKAVEVERPKSTSPQDHLADPPDSTCPQVIHSRPEAIGNSWVPMTATKEGEEQDDNANRQLFENALMGKDLEIGVPRIPNLELENPNEKALDIIADIDKEKLSDMNSKKDDEQLEKKQQDLIRDELNGDVRNQASDFMDVITDSNDSPMESTVFDIPNDLFKDSGKKEKAVHDNNELPSLGLSLKSLRDYGDTGTRLHEKNVLRHSDQHSAFTRYNSASTANQSAIGNVSSGSPLDNSSEAAKTESVQNLQSHTNGTLPSQRSNGSSNNSDMGLTTSSAFTKPMVFSDKPTPNSTVKCLHPSAFQRAQNGHTSLPQPVVQGKADTAMSSTNLVQVGGMNQQVQVQHHHHHYHHHHHHVHNIPQQQLANQDNLLLKNMAAAAAQCRSSNVLHVPFEGNTSNHNLNGSNQGSNEHKGSCIASTARGSNIESDNGLAMKGGDGDGIGYGSQSRVDKNRLELREAALNKFRQKRKERCFEKKVRYQSRKKLAEQRPRVRGQFVRQVVHENK